MFCNSRTLPTFAIKYSYSDGTLVTAGHVKTLVMILYTIQLKKNAECRGHSQS